MEIKDRTIALLIDSQNISKKYYTVLIEELSKYGRIIYRRLYGDFSNSLNEDWKSVIRKHSVQLVQQVTYTAGKNASDSSLIIDAMDILYRGKADCFCIVTSDSDFTGLAVRIREENMIVIGCGERKTPEALQNACDLFIRIDDLLLASSVDANKIVTKNNNSAPIPPSDSTNIANTTKSSNSKSKYTKIHKSTLAKKDELEKTFTSTTLFSSINTTNFVAEADVVRVITEEKTTIESVELAKADLQDPNNAQGNNIESCESIVIIENEEVSSVELTEGSNDAEVKHTSTLAEKEKNKALLIDVAKNIVTTGVKSDGWMDFSVFMSELHKAIVFDPQSYGHTSKKLYSFFNDLVFDTGKKVFRFNAKHDHVKLNIK
ncbi:MAG: NYN domain-containing protein [Christensenellaceae bacterium]|jgi:uncharacterized protein (TIGR00288 family)|nr:NYN domain-containing protein [Christensenellaceae bacterium]